jgi:hypothetical protein
VRRKLKAPVNDRVTRFVSGRVFAAQAVEVALNRCTILSRPGTGLCLSSEAVPDIVPAAQQGAFTPMDEVPVICVKGEQVAGAGKLN